MKDCEKLFKFLLDKKKENYQEFEQFLNWFYKTDLTNVDVIMKVFEDDCMVEVSYYDKYIDTEVFNNIFYDDFDIVVEAYDEFKRLKNNLFIKIPNSYKKYYYDNEQEDVEINIEDDFYWIYKIIAQENNCDVDCAISYVIYHTLCDYNNETDFDIVTIFEIQDMSENELEKVLKKEHAIFNEKTEMVGVLLPYKKYNKLIKEKFGSDKVDFFEIIESYE